MRPKGPDVVAAWGAFLALAFFTLLIYGESLFATVLFASVVALIEIVAAVAWWALHTRPDTIGDAVVPSHSYTAMLMAGIVALVGAGFIFKPWMMAPAIYLLIALVLQLSAAARARRRERMADEAPPLPPYVQRSPRHGMRAAAVATTGLVAGFLVARRNRGGRR
jgi:hypothetical protein